MSKPVYILIAETSGVICRGISSIIQETNLPSFVLSEISEAEQLKNTLARKRPDMLIINPSFSGCMSLSQIKKDAANPNMKCVILQTSLADAAIARYYDEAISIYDSADSIKDKLVRLLQSSDSDKRRESLSQREKEIVTCVIKGMANRQIAEKLSLSIHTINTHRRNISAKLDIHSIPGLTIYAISKKLVRIEELNGMD